MIYSKLSMQRYEKFREMQKEKAFFLFHTSDAATKKAGGLFGSYTES